MAKNFFDKNQAPDAPGSANDDVQRMLERRRRVAPADPSQTDPATGGYDDGNYGQPSSAPVPATQPVQAPPSADVLTALSDGITNGSLTRSPYYQELLKTRDQLIALKTQPTYVDKKGQTRQGLEDKNGRLKSGLQAALERIGSYRGGFRSMGDVYGMLAGGAGAGVGGAINSSWDENQQRDQEIARLEDQAKGLMQSVQFDSQMQNQATNRVNQSRRVDVAAGQLAERKARNQIQNLKDEQKMVLDPIFKRGYFYEEDTDPETLAKLQKLGVVMPDFDTRHKQVVDNGVTKSYNPATRKYEQVDGTDVDPDEQPITFEIDGQKVTTSRKWFVNYAGAKERQTSQQTFQADENAKRRELDWAQLKLAVEKFRASSEQDYIEKRLKIETAIKDGDVSEEKGAELLESLDRNNKGLKSTPK